jgi:hypothetical protein
VREKVSWYKTKPQTHRCPSFKRPPIRCMMQLRQTDRGIEVISSSYRLLLEKAGGFAVREVEIFGPGRLDRFDRPGEGPHPTCMHFDNMTVNNAFQLAHYGKTNSTVEATIDGAGLKIAGDLIPIVDNAQGRVAIEKQMRFDQDLYDVELHLRFEGTGPIDFASVWWDVNDTWLRAMRSSSGVFMPLRVGVGDSFAENLIQTWRPMTAMDRGAGVWIEMIGQSASIMTVLQSPSPQNFPAGGMKYWDGPDDADEGPGVSHGCINLDAVNCEMSGHKPLDIKELSLAYRVFLSGPTVLRDV